MIKSKTDDGETRNYREIKKAGQHGMDKEDECHLSWCRRDDFDGNDIHERIMNCIG